jgi:hypothetical protein
MEIADDVGTDYYEGERANLGDGAVDLDLTNQRAAARRDPSQLLRTPSCNRPGQVRPGPAPV